MSYELIVNDHHLKSEISDYEYSFLTQENAKKYRKKATYQESPASINASTNDYSSPAMDYGSSNSSNDNSSDNSFGGFGGGDGGGAGAGGSWDSDSSSSGGDSSSYDSGSSDSGSSSSSD